MSRARATRPTQTAPHPLKRNHNVLVLVRGQKLNREAYSGVAICLVSGRRTQPLNDQVTLVKLLDSDAPGPRFGLLCVVTLSQK